METRLAALAREAGALVLESDPTSAMVRTGSGAVVEIAADLAHVVPPGARAAVVGELWPRGRWAMTFRGRPGLRVTPMGARNDPMLTYAMVALAVAKQARLRSEHGVRASVVGQEVSAPDPDEPVETMSAVLDVRAPQVAVRDGLVDAIRTQGSQRAERDGTVFTLEDLDVSDLIPLDRSACERLAVALAAPVVSTPAGDRAAAYARSGERVASLAMSEPDTELITAALAALA
ncbi:hypothetical protein [Mumia flava]|uniref:hypothetical protein n=1 Tax=Mumia flava TaxID=1348852 RepID=UPI000C251669|nr:hypothetical protein [Mumia flava]